MRLDPKKLRDKFGLSQDEFALLLGVHPRTVSKWERGVLSPDSYRQQLLEVADVSIRYDKDLGVKIQVLLHKDHIMTALFYLLKPSES